jgi:cytochrome c-type biogenesis protein CcmF
MTGEAISVGGPYFALTFAPLMSACLLILPAGPLLAWKRADLPGAVQRLWAAALFALAVGAGSWLFINPKKAFASLGLMLGAWLIVGALSEVAIRVQLGTAGLTEVGRRIRGLPRGAWGMTLAHLGLGVFVLGACVESSWKLETASALSIGQSVRMGGFTLTLDDVRDAAGPNYDAERGTVTVRGPHGTTTIHPERRFYPTSRQTTSQVAIERHGASDLYVVLGEQRAATGAKPAWLVRAYWNPWARMIFGGPLLMALGGLISLSDRRLRIAAGAKAGRATVLAAAE